MNLNQPAPAFARARATAAFTLPEILVSTTVFLLLLLGIISATLFGMRWFQISQTKLLASDSARKAIGKMTDEIRSCNSTYVGYLDTNGIFAERTNGDLQVGSSLLIYPTTNTTNFILYFYNPIDQTFRRTCTLSGLTTIVAQTVTNTNIFEVENYLGTVQTNNSDCRVIRCTLQFYQTAPNTPVPTAYTLDTAVTKRAL
jgi:type II secretory pathway pseudopilin PulG